MSIEGLDIFKSWSELYPIASHHIHSFDNWRLFGLEATMDAISITGIHNSWRFRKARLAKPSISPSEAMLRSTTYDTNVLVDIEETNSITGEVLVYDNVIIARVPMMVYPCEDGGDPIGGYFIINGIQRVIVSQIRQAYNQPIITFPKAGSKKSRVRPCDIFNVTNTKPGTEMSRVVKGIKDIYKRQPDTICVQLNIRSISEASNHSCATEIVLTVQNQILIANSKYSGRLPVGIMLKALGCNNLGNFEWVTMGDTDCAKRLYVGSLMVKDQMDALDFLAKKMVFTQRTVESVKPTPQNVMKFLIFELFPHMGLTTTSGCVALYIGSLVRSLFVSRRTGVADDRDSLRFKRFEPTGVLINDLFGQIVKRWSATVGAYCKKHDKIILGIPQDFITRRIEYCFRTGTWVALLISNYKRMGVVQQRAMGSIVSLASHAQRLTNPISRETKNLQVRKLHTSHAFFLCPAESPEGHAVGIVKNLAASARITSGVVPAAIIDAISHLIHPLTVGGREATNPISINGRIIGGTDFPEHFVVEFINLRRLGRFDGGVNQGMVSIGVISGHIMIWSDDGRLVRPVLTGKAGKFSNWREGLLGGQLQWIDAFEQEFGPTNHNWSREIHPALMVGISASLIPFGNYQPMPRWVYACGMIKQAISSIMPTQQNILLPTSYLGRFQQKPLVNTVMSEIFGLDDSPIGTNVIVAICPFNGYNQEDAIVLNKASVDRGLFAADIQRTFSYAENCENEKITVFCIPNKKIRNPLRNYCMLDKRGIISIGMRVEVGDVIIGQELRHYDKVEDVSISINKGEEGIVHNVVYNNSGRFAWVKVVIVGKLDVIVADKFASRFGQKGVVGKIVQPWELPFCDDGTIPDLLMNPLALPSRMTIPTIMEALFGLVCLETGKRCKTTLFDELPSVRQQLKDYGIDSSGCRLMRNAINGERMVPIFVGPMYYFRISQLAEPKCYARSRGVLSKHMRQPTDGRSRQGGLRVGEMERDAIVALNMPHVLEDRFFSCSDKFWVHVCKKCKDRSINGNICFCGATGKDIVRIKLGFASNLVFSQLKSMGCLVKFNVDTIRNLTGKLDRAIDNIAKDDSDNEELEYEDDDEKNGDLDEEVIEDEEEKYLSGEEDVDDEYNGNVDLIDDDNIDDEDDLADDEEY